MTKILFNGNRIIFDGHADTAEECRAITAMCDSMANNENFKTIVYEEGHAVFEQVSGGESELFAMKDYVLTSRYNKEVLGGAKYDHAQSIQKRLIYLETEIVSLQVQINELKNKTSYTLPYTAAELEAKLANL